MAVRKEIVRTGRSEIAGVFLIAICAMLALSLWSYQPEDVPALQYPPRTPPANWIGPLGAWTGYFTFMVLGVGGYLLLPAIFAVAGYLLFQRTGRLWPKAAAAAAAVAAVSTAMDLEPDWWIGTARRLNIEGVPGGLLGEWLGQRVLAPVIGQVGALIIAYAVLTAALILLFGIRPAAVAGLLARGFRFAQGKLLARLKDRRDRRDQLEQEARELEKKRRRLERALGATETASGAEERARRPEASALTPEPPAPPATPAPVERPKPDPDAAEPALPPRPPRAPRPPREKVAEPKPPSAPPPPPPPGAPYQLPPLTLLAPAPPMAEREIRGDLGEIGRTLIETLAEFNIEAQLTNIEQGPVVTRIELLPAPGVRVERIAGLSNNLALALKAESVRVQAPIPGKGVVGIEVPNIKTTLVYLRDVLESEVWRNSRAALPLAIGKDVGGRVIVADLAAMPHLLIAGATGSGKTVCMNSLLAALLMSRTPEQLRLMLVDPKIVEFSAYNNLPHLIAPVITDAKKVALGLRWVIAEMEKRYKLFARVGVRNIQDFNARPVERQAELFADGARPEAPNAADGGIPAKLPYIVVVVDELADLMLAAQADIENSIARLAQLSRAVGIHMIIATQRPSVNVITGTIKANFPARIAFQVAQKVDSRTILDANGADKLLGKGDMLFLPPGTAKMIRAQGCMTSDREVHAIADFIRAQGAPNFETAIKEKLEKKGVDLPDMEEDDELIEQAIEIIRQTQRASTSSLQRRLKIGYTRAARIMDLLEERGIVGPAQGSDPREIRIDLDGDIPSHEDPPADSP